MTLDVPAVGSVLRLLRLSCLGAAEMAGMDTDDLDDVRVAIDELAVALFEVAPAGARLRLRLEVLDGDLQLFAQLSANCVSTPQLSDLATSVLAHAVDVHHLFSSNGSAGFHLRKHRSSSAG